MTQPTSEADVLGEIEADIARMEERRGPLDEWSLVVKIVDLRKLIAVALCPSCMEALQLRFVGADSRKVIIGLLRAP